MSFEINSPNNQPIIRESANVKDGGAGNLGYFEREDSENKKKKQEETSIFESKEKVDSFQKESDVSEIDDETFSFSKIIAEAIFTVKEWFKSLLGKK